MNRPSPGTPTVAGPPVLVATPTTGASADRCARFDHPPAPHSIHSGEDPPPSSADEARFRVLFAANYEALLRFAERRSHPLAAEDVVADVLLVAWRRLDDVPAPPAEARAWLFAVAQHTLANQRRGETRQRSLHVRVGQHSHDAHVSPDASAEVAVRVDLARAWALLSPTDQEVLTLTALDGLTASEAARVLGVSTTAVSVRLLRARRRLKVHLPTRNPARASRRPSGDPR